MRQEKLGERSKLSQEVSLLEDELAEPSAGSDDQAASPVGSLAREGAPTQAVRLVWARSTVRVDPAVQQRAKAARWAPAFARCDGMWRLGLTRNIGCD